MRVLHVYRTYYPDPPGGLQEAIRQIALATRMQGIEAEVFALSPNSQPITLVRPEGQVTRSHSWAAPASCDLGNIDAFKRFSSRAKSADVVHYHFPWPFADLLHLVVQPSVPSVITYHSDIVRQRLLKRLYRPLMMWMLKSTTAIVATSPAYAKSSPVLSDPGVAHRIRTIPLGIDRANYPHLADETILDRLALVKSEPYFLFVGVLRQYKGLKFLVQAATKVGAPIVIAGTGPENDALQELKRSIGAGNVIFAGQVSNEEKVALLRHCRALVLPSHLRSEAFGMVLVEAAMYGRPLICCEVGSGTSFVNIDGETGFVVPPENPEALAAAMNVLLEDDVLADKFGRAAMRRYEELFSGPALGKAYSDLYQDVLKD